MTKQCAEIGVTAFNIPCFSEGFNMVHVLGKLEAACYANLHTKG